ncbi:MAG: transglutaminase domain-containing protein [Bacteroidales bacterium]|nr:transglutaminase domain-containing protein [Bacteroidales bacterium]
MQKTNETQVEYSAIKNTVANLISGAKTDTEKMEKIFYFVRDSIKFGWVYPMEITAEEVLKNKRGICVQKTNLLIAMTREAGLKARFHFLYVYKNALEDFLPAFAYKRWVNPFPHTISEVYLNGKWVSMDATFDKEIHEICIRQKINFGKNPNIVSQVSIEFSEDGVKGHQQYYHAEGKDSFYGESLNELTKYMIDVPWWKRVTQPLIYRKAQKIINKIRDTK